MRLRLVKNPRARRYILRVGRAGDVRVTIPRGGTTTQARQFAERNASWVEKQLLKQVTRIRKRWCHGTEILFRGSTETIRVELSDRGLVARFATETVPVTDAADVRSEIEQWLRTAAASELPTLVLELSALHGVPVRRVTVRDQRSRWGSCSRRGTVSLNWRLIHAPEFVRDYIIFHELAHFKEMNHSRRFWKEVARLCPAYETAEKWIKSHSDLLR